MTVRMIRRFPGDARNPLGVDIGSLYNGPLQDYFLSTGMADRRLELSPEYNSDFAGVPEPAYQRGRLMNNQRIWVPTATTGVLFTAVRQLDAASTFSLAAGSDANLTISSGGAISATAGLTASANQFAVVTETPVAGSGAKPITYRVTLTGQAAAGVTPTPAYLPSVATGGTPMVYGMKRMVPGYNGNLFRLTRASDSATLNVACAASSDLPDYAAISAWAAGAALTVTTWYDQNGGAKNFTYPGAVAGQGAPSFDVSQALAGCSPILWDGQRTTVNGPIAKTLRLDTLALDAANMSVIDVAASMSSFVDNTFWVGTPTGDGGLPVGATIRSVLNGLALYSSPTAPEFGYANTAPRINPDVYVSTYSPTGYETHVRGGVFAPTTGGLVPASSAVNSLILGRINSVSTSSGSTYGRNSRLRRWGFVVYPTALSTADATTVRTALYSMFSIQTTFTSRLVLGTDSIMEGSGVALNNNLPSQLGLSPSVEIFNVAVHGQTLAGEYPSRATRYQPLATAAYGAGKCVFITQGGSNDTAQGTTGAATYSITTNYITQFKGYGYKVGIATVLPRTDESGAANTERLDYNSRVVANSGGADFIIDLASDSIMGAALAPNDTSLYIDLIHPTAAGDLRLAPIYRAGLATQGIT